MPSVSFGQVSHYPEKYFYPDELIHKIDQKSEKIVQTIVQTSPNTNKSRPETQFSSPRKKFLKKPSKITVFSKQASLSTLCHNIELTQPTPSKISTTDPLAVQSQIKKFIDEINDLKSKTHLLHTTCLGHD